jgi:hypothetical protein
MYKNIKNKLIIMTLITFSLFLSNTEKVSANTVLEDNASNSPISTARCVYYFPTTIVDSNDALVGTSQPKHSPIFGATTFFTIDYNNGYPTATLTPTTENGMSNKIKSNVTKPQMESSSTLICPKVFVVVEDLYNDYGGASQTKTLAGYLVNVYGTNLGGDYTNKCAAGKKIERCAEIDPNMEESKIYNASTYSPSKSCVYVSGKATKATFTISMKDDKVTLNSAIWYATSGGTPTDLIEAERITFDPNITVTDMGNCNPINVCTADSLFYSISREKKAGCEVVYSNDNLSKNADDLNAYYQSEKYRVDFIQGIPKCNSFVELMDFLDEMYFLIIIFVVVGLVVYGMLDFTQAVLSEKPDSITLAFKKFKTRAIIVIIIILLPSLLNMTFSIFTGASENKPEICIPRL